MTNEEALVGFQNLYNEIDKDNHLFVGTINPEWIQMAIEALENNDKLAEDLQNCLDMYKKKKAEVESLKQTQWIPCEERLPEPYVDVIVTAIVRHTGDIETDVNYVNDEKEWNKKYWQYTNGFGLLEPIAWMPLPKPYEGGTDAIR